MTKIITMSLRKGKKSCFSKEWNNRVPADGSLLRLNVTASRGEPFIAALFYIQHIRDEARGRFSNWRKSLLWQLCNPGKDLRCVLYPNTWICVWVCSFSKVAAWMTTWSMGGQVSCQHVLLSGVSTAAVSGDLIIWWTQQWRGPHSYQPLSRCSSLMQSRGGAYRKYWSYFDRVFSPLCNQNCHDADSLHQTPLQMGHTYQHFKAGSPVFVR